MLQTVTTTKSLVIPSAPNLAETGLPEIPIFVDMWQGQTTTSGKVLLILHGLGEHCGRYKHFPKYLGGEFERFYAMDQRGHGRSGGLRGYSPNFDQFVADLLRVAADVQTREPGKKLYLAAHSFGGLVALRTLLREKKVPFSGAIISAPLLGVTLKVPAYKKALGELLGRTFSRVQLNNEVNPSYLSHDPKVVAAYVNDRLVHSKITPRLYLDMMQAIEWVKAQTGPLAAPAIFLIPGQDKIVDSAKTLEFFRNLKFREKELREYPEMYHEVFNETDKEKVFEDVKKWLTNASVN